LKKLTEAGVRRRAEWLYQQLDDLQPLCRQGDRKYLNVFPSKKAVQREREKLRDMTNRHQCHKPIPVLIGELNRHLKGWMNYFSFGYPSSTYCEIERLRSGPSNPAFATAQHRGHTIVRKANNGFNTWRA
jgi:hypothetical protein